MKTNFSVIIAAALILSIGMITVDGIQPAYANHPVLVEGWSPGSYGLDLWQAFYNSFFGIFGR